MTNNKDDIYSITNYYFTIHADVCLVFCLNGNVNDVINCIYEKNKSLLRISGNNNEKNKDIIKRLKNEFEKKIINVNIMSQKIVNI